MKHWEYGKSPDPTNWDEAVKILEQQKKPKNDLLDRLTRIETMLKEKKS